MHLPDNSPIPRRATWVMVLLLAAIIASYAFYSGIFSDLPLVRDARKDYFQMLGKAFLSGDTYIDKYLYAYHNITPPENVDPAKAPNYFTDTSYYNGHYYVYWGPVPVLLIWIPIKLLTGISVGAGFMGFIFASAGITSLAILFFKIAARLGGIPVWAAVFATLSVAYGTWIPFMLRGARFYETPCLGGYAFTALALLCCWLYWEKGKGVWLVLFSLCLGLAVGCRINLIFNGLFIVLALIYLHSGCAGYGRVKMYMQALLPWLACLAGYGIYNYARFDSFFQVGIAHQVSWLDWKQPDFRLFTPEWALEHGYLYLFNPLQWKSPVAFPFFSPVSFWKHVSVPWMSGTVPYSEPTFGLLSNSPFALFYLLVAAHWKNRREWPVPLRLIVHGLLLYSAILLGFYLLHYYVTQRYAVDFSPWLMAISGISYMLSLRACRGQKTCFRALLAVGALFCLYGIFTGTMSGYCGYFRC